MEQFDLLKKGACSSLPTPEEIRYDGPFPVNVGKATDL